eukprot:6192259-Pleurochrysis_carterae.AAC.2
MPRGRKNPETFFQQPSSSLTPSLNENSDLNAPDERLTHPMKGSEALDGKIGCSSLSMESSAVAQGNPSGACVDQGMAPTDVVLLAVSGQLCLTDAGETITGAVFAGSDPAHLTKSSGGHNTSGDQQNEPCMCSGTLTSTAVPVAQQAGSGGLAEKSLFGSQEFATPAQDSGENSAASASLPGRHVGICSSTQGNILTALEEFQLEARRSHDALVARTSLLVNGLIKERDAAILRAQQAEEAVADLQRTARAQSAEAALSKIVTDGVSSLGACMHRWKQLRNDEEANFPPTSTASASVAHVEAEDAEHALTDTGEPAFAGRMGTAKGGTEAASQTETDAAATVSHVSQGVQVPAGADTAHSGDQHVVTDGDTEAGEQAMTPTHDAGASQRVTKASSSSADGGDTTSRRPAGSASLFQRWFAPSSSLEREQRPSYDDLTNLNDGLLKKLHHLNVENTFLHERTAHLEDSMQNLLRELAEKREILRHLYILHFRESASEPTTAERLSDWAAKSLVFLRSGEARQREQELGDAMELVLEETLKQNIELQRQLGITKASALPADPSIEGQQHV